MKKLALIVTSLFALCALAACGSGAIDTSKIEGDWYLETITVEGVAGDPADYGFDSAIYVGDDYMTMTTNGIDTEFSIELASDGFTATSDAGDVLPMAYSESDDTLTYQTNIDGISASYTYAPY